MDVKLKEIMLNSTRCTITEEADLDVNENFYFQWNDVIKIAIEFNSEFERLQKYTEIDNELKRAKEKHPDFPKDMFHQLTIMQEEAGEVTKAVLHYHYEKGSLDDIRKELIQTAAMCMRMIEFLERKLK